MQRLISDRILDPLFGAAAVVLICSLVARFWKLRSAPLYFLVQLLGFGTLTALLATGGVVPYPHGTGASLGHPKEVLVSALEIIWWLGVAWLTHGFLRAFVLLGRKPEESKLLQDLTAGIIYIATALAIFSDVFNWPIQGVLATSGAVAVILGLALQSSLGDVFSGIVLNIESPYRVGDWIIVDNAVQGRVIEINWRATRVMIASESIAIIPNSVVAKAKLVNCSTPTRVHIASFRIKLEPSISPMAACRLLDEVLLGSDRILRDPTPRVTVHDISAESLELQLSYAVMDVTTVDEAQNDLFDRVFRAVAAAGIRFAPRLSTSPRSNGSESAPTIEQPRCTP